MGKEEPMQPLVLLILEKWEVWLSPPTHLQAHQEGQKYACQLQSDFVESM